MKNKFLQVAIFGVIIGSPLCAISDTPDWRSDSNEFQPDLNHRLFLHASGLGYSEDASSFVSQWVLTWDGKRGMPLVKCWSDAFAKSKVAYQAGKLSDKKWCRSQENIATKIARHIFSKVKYDRDCFDLKDVATKKRGQCLGLTQLYYVVAKAVGFEIVPILVLPDYETVMREHVACLVQLGDDKYMMVDLASNNMTSLPFTFQNHYASDETANIFFGHENRLGLYRKIQRLDQDGLLALVHNSRASDLAVCGHDQQAMSLYSDAIKMNPRYATAWANRAIVYLKRENTDAALCDINRAIELCPGMAEAHNTLGLVYSKTQDHKNAVKAFSTAIQLNCDFAKAYNNRGVAYWKLGQYEKSLKDYSDALELKSGYVSAYVNRATVYGHLERYEEAIRDCSLAIQHAPACYQAYQSRGMWFSKLNETDSAQEDLLYAQVLRRPLK